MAREKLDKKLFFFQRKALNEWGLASPPPFRVRCEALKGEGRRKTEKGGKKGGEGKEGGIPDYKIPRYTRVIL